ncbi:MAG: hypothetical protein LJE93_14170 [Acidobacteria bacterium]|nr:hypothetical protein [Acidobacteriota bacterium]
MSTQRKLTELLRELQQARSPLAQARIVARAWRTVREISPTDRRLLARHLAFDGAEEILDALARRKGGMAPSALLRGLAEARAADGSKLQEMVAAIRDPERLEEVVVAGADLATSVLEDETDGEAARESFELIDSPQAAENIAPEVPETNGRDRETASPEMAPRGEASLAAKPEDKAEVTDETPNGRATVSEVEPLRELPGPPQKPAPLMVDWSRWDSNRKESAAPPESQPYQDVLAGETPGTGDFGRHGGIGAAVEGASVLPRLLAFRRHIRESSGTGFDELQSLVESFPDGWMRRRAICAVFDEGIADRIDDALELVSSLGRESDRRWCLCVLAARGLLQGESLEGALALLDSRFARKRVEHLAGLAV